MSLTRYHSLDHVSLANEASNRQGKEGDQKQKSKGREEAVSTCCGVSLVSCYVLVLDGGQYVVLLPSFFCVTLRDTRHGRKGLPPRALHETQKQRAVVYHHHLVIAGLALHCTCVLRGIWLCLAWGPAHSRSRPGKQNRLEAGLGPAHARHTWRALLDARETRTDCNNNKLTPRHPVPRQAPTRPPPRLPVGLSKQAKQGKARQGKELKPSIMEAPGEASRHATLSRVGAGRH